MIGRVKAEIMSRLLRVVIAGIALVFRIAAAEAAEDPLPSWSDSPAKSAIVDFVEAVTAEGGADYVAPPDRVGVFDNDGTLWIEQPIYTQLAFALDRVKTLAPEHPEWRQQEPFKSALAGDLKGVAAGGERGVIELVMATHAGMTTDEFTGIVRQWLAQARHPRFARPYTDLVYQPMLELLAYLRDNSFKTYIASGGGIEFMRPWTEEIYGVPPEQVIGSSIKTAFEIRDGAPILLRLPEIDFIDDKAGEPVGINKFIGRRPIAAFGNSDGDLEMLQWVTSGPGRRLGLIVRHDDAKREYAYDRESHVGRLDKALDAAGPSGWIVVSMRNDWAKVFADH